MPEGTALGSVEVAGQPTVHESFFGGEVAVWEAAPDQSNQATEPEVYYAHGAGHAKEEPTVREIARQGRRAFAMELRGKRQADPRFMIGHVALNDATFLHQVSHKQIRARLEQLGLIVPVQQMREAASLLGLIDERGGQQAGRVDAIFQSESAGHGIIAANAEPHKFRNIVLAFPGAINGPQRGFIPLRMVKELLVRRRSRPADENNFIPSRKTSRFQALRERLKAPGAMADARGLRYAALATMLHALREREGAPSVTLVVGLDDQIFPLEGYFDSLRAAIDVDRIIIVPGGHAIQGRRDIMGQILEQLEPGHEQSLGNKHLPLRNRIVLPDGLDPSRAEHILAMADEVDRRTPAPAQVT